MSIFKVEEVSEEAFFSVPIKGARANPEYGIIYRRILDLKPHNGNNQAIKIDGKYNELKRFMNSATQYFNSSIASERNGFKIRCKIGSAVQKDVPSTLYIRKFFLEEKEDHV